MLTMLVLSIAVTASFVIERQALRNEHRTLEYELQQAAYTLSERIQREVLHHEITALAVAGAIRANPYMSSVQFANTIRPLIEGHDSILNVAAAPDLVVRHVYPLRGNESVVGLDYGDLPGQLEAIEYARDNGEMVFTGPIQLVQGGSGFIERAPVFQRNMHGEEVFWGVVSIVSDADKIVAEIGFDDISDRAEIAMRSFGLPGQPSERVWGDAGVFDQNPVMRSMAFGAGSWELALIPNGGWPAAASNRSAIRWTIAAIAAMTLVALHAILYLAIQRRAAQRQLRNAIEVLDDGFALFDPDDRLIMCNQRFRDLYSVSADLMVEGATFEEIIRGGAGRGQFPDAIGREEEWITERLEKHANPSAPIEQELEDGRWLKIAEAKTEDGYTVGFRVDVTELKIARETAERANRAKTDFLNVVSHELRTPLTAILGYSTILTNLERLPAHGCLKNSADSGEPVEPDALSSFVKTIKTYSTRIDSAGQDLLALINDILYWSKSQSVSMTIDRKAVALDELIDSAVRKLAGSAHHKNLTLTGDGGGLSVCGDPERLNQVLINIIGNAVKFTAEGSVEVWADLGAGEEVRIHVRDTGCGIPEDSHDAIFERFSQVDNSMTRAQNGAGLGLSISRDIVLLHGGTISVSSRLHEGTTFTISLPRYAEQEMAA